ncbi:hypothetical protein GCM10009603_17410 [Nocardiopsis exhalans]
MTGKNGMPGLTGLDTTPVPDVKPYLFQAHAADLRTIGARTQARGFLTSGKGDEDSWQGQVR